MEIFSRFLLVFFAELSHVEPHTWRLQGWCCCPQRHLGWPPGPARSPGPAADSSRDPPKVPSWVLEKWWNPLEDVYIYIRIHYIYDYIIPIISMYGSYPLVFSGIPTRLKNIQVNWDDETPNPWKNEKCSKLLTKWKSPEVSKWGKCCLMLFTWKNYQLFNGQKKHRTTILNFIDIMPMQIPMPIGTTK